MFRFRIVSLKGRIVLWTGLMVSVTLALFTVYTALTYRAAVEQSVFHDVETENVGHVQAIHAVFKGKADILLALRDDLEHYDTVGQMWVHMAAHAGEKIFEDRAHPTEYARSYRRKLDTFLQSDQLGPAQRTPQIQRMLAKMETRQHAFGDGMKFLYLGVARPKAKPEMRAYEEYQDSSLWVPDPEVDAPYNPLVRPWYLTGQEAGRDRVFFTEPYGERRTGEAVASAATAIDIHGVRGTIAAAISIKPVMDLLLGTFPHDHELMIFSRGTPQATAFVSTPPKYVYSSRDLALGNRFRAYNDPEVVANAAHRDVMRLYDATAASDAGTLAWDIDGTTFLFAYHTVPDVGWKVFTGMSRDQMMAGANAVAQRIAVLSVLGIVLLLVVIWLVVRKALRPIDQIGVELRELADTGDLSKRATVRRDDEVGGMARAINAMLDDTAAPIRELGDREQRIAQGERDVNMDIKAKGDIAALIAAFKYMKRRLIEFEQSFRDASPLTGLPGGVSIEAAVKKRIANREPFVFCLFDLDHFKPFNDRYGYNRGNLVIRHTAALIEAASRAQGSATDFIGHIGGDDFVLVTTPECARAVCEAVIQAFDAQILDFYDEADRQAGRITSRNRQGVTSSFSIMAMSVCAVNSTQYELTDYIRVGEIAAELKAYAKRSAGSTFVVDQRHGAAASDDAARFH